jgi:hypothetical protein
MSRRVYEFGLLLRHLDRREKQREAEYILDLAPFSDLLFDKPQGLPVLIKEIGQIRESIDKMGGTFERLTNKLEDGIYINSNVLSRGCPLPVEKWKASVTSNLIEFQLMWSSLYGVSYERFNDAIFFSSLKNYYTSVGKRLLVLVSLAPDEIPRRLKEGLESFSKELMEVEEPKFVAAEKDLDKYGNRFLVDIEAILEQITKYSACVS